MDAAPITTPALEIVASRVPDRESGKQAEHGSGSRFFVFKQATYSLSKLCSLGLGLQGLGVWEFQNFGLRGCARLMALDFGCLPEHLALVCKLWLF